MKIHTTQDLNSLVQLNQLSSINNVSSKDFRLKNYSEQMLMPKVSAESADFYSSSISFGRKPAVRDAKKVIIATKKTVGDIKKDPRPKERKGDKAMDSPFFNSILKIADNETLTTATIAAIACIFRAFTIGMLPAKDENTKMNNTYAIGHALASGATGFGVAFLLTSPFKHGARYVMNHMRQTLKTSTLERLYPQLDSGSIGPQNARKAIKEWKNKDGLPFCDEIKKVDLLPEFQQLADVSEKTFEKVLKITNVDWASQKGKSFNDVVLKDGKKLYDEIDMSKLGIKVKEDGIGNAQILFNDIKKDYFEKVIKDSSDDKTSMFYDLDIESVFDGDTIRDFRKWKKLSNGKQFILDLDRTYVASPFETLSTYKTRISGEKRYDAKEKVYKFRSYQVNGQNHRLGTEISDAMLKAEDNNEVLNKALTWGPDLVFRIPIAMTTVALIPWILKKGFGLEKNKGLKAQPAQVQAENNNNEKDKDVAFKAKPDKEKASWFVRKLAEWYGKPLLDSERVYNITSHLTKLPGRTTQHMTVAGSALTSGMYVQQTLNKKELDPQKRKTLAVNQTLCFVIPTFLAYTVDHFITNAIKKKEYQYSGLQQRKIDLLKLDNKHAEIENLLKGLGTKLKGVRILADLLTFTLIYRYIVPVAITPVANRIGDRLNAKSAAKNQAKEIALQQYDIGGGDPDNKKLKQSA